MGDSVSRRLFMGATGSALGMGITGCASMPGKRTAPAAATGLTGDVQALVAQTPFVDTHEHLRPEADRVAAAEKGDTTGAQDFGLLLSHYSNEDLQVAGMSREDYRKVVGGSLSPKEKWKLVAPYYERCRNTGYLKCVRESVRVLYGEEDIREDNCEAISRRLREEVRPGYYRRILRDVAHIEYAQISDNSDFRKNPVASELLCYDLRTAGIASTVNRDTLNECAGAEINTLKQAHEAIDRIFAESGPKAIAVKDVSGYTRRLNFEDVSDEDAAPLFARFAQQGPSLSPGETKALQDNLFRRCIRRATEQRLPVKLHTGYHSGHGSMELANVRDNLSDVARLVRDFPDTTFVLMHITYPYQHELIALCKHYPRVYADMCWAWIIDPVSSTRFLTEFLTAAPACKIFTFGGDFSPVELVPGHAQMARQGIALAVSRLVEEGWLDESDVPALVDRIMRGNAHETFDLERVLRASA